MKSLTDISIQELQKMDTDELRHLVQRNARNLNRRLANIKYDPDSSKLAYNLAMNTGGKFTTRSHVDNKASMNRSELIDEAKREKNFMLAKGSTVSSARWLKAKIEIQTAGTTAKEFAKAEALKAKRDYTSSIKNKHKTKAQIKKGKNIYDKTYKAAKRAYDKAISEYWKNFRKYKEERKDHVQGSPREVALNIQEYMWNSEEEQRKHFEEVYNKYLNQPIQQQAQKPIQEFNPYDLLKKDDDNESPELH